MRLVAARSPPAGICPSNSIGCHNYYGHCQDSLPEHELAKTNKERQPPNQHPVYHVDRGQFPAPVQQSPTNNSGKRSAREVEGRKPDKRQ